MLFYWTRGGRNPFSPLNALSCRLRKTGFHYIYRHQLKKVQTGEYWGEVCQFKGKWFCMSAWFGKAPQHDQRERTSLAAATPIPINAATTRTHIQRVSRAGSPSACGTGEAINCAAGSVADAVACGAGDAVGEIACRVEGVAGPNRMDAAVVASNTLPSLGTPCSRSKNAVSAQRSSSLSKLGSL